MIHWKVILSNLIALIIPLNVVIALVFILGTRDWESGVWLFAILSLVGCWVVYILIMSLISRTEWYKDRD